MKLRKKIPESSEYITTQEFNTFIAENFAARLKQADLVKKTDFDNRQTSKINKLLQIKKKLKVLKKPSSLTTKDYNLFYK